MTNLVTRQVAQTGYRKRTFYFLRRSLQFHANTSGIGELDVTNLVTALAGNPVGGAEPTITAAVIKATGMVLAAMPQLNRHLFHGLFARYEVQFDQVHCTVPIARKTPSGEIVVLPCVIRNSDRASIPEIVAQLAELKKKPLDELPEYQAIQKLGRMPWLLRKWIGFKSRSDHRFHEKFVVGTYGVSAFLNRHIAPTTVTHAISPYGCSFFPGNAVDRAWVVDGKLAVRKIMTMTIVVDHYLFDGGEAAVAMTKLGQLLADPAALGLTAAPALARAGDPS